MVQPIRSKTNGRVAVRVSVSVVALACTFAVGGLSNASAETIRDSLAQAYRWNPKLDAARATMRATDEQVAIANSGYRPNRFG